MSIAQNVSSSLSSSNVPVSLVSCSIGFNLLLSTPFIVKVSFVSVQARDGACVVEGPTDGMRVFVGDAVGELEGNKVGLVVGELDGETDGEIVGDVVGAAVVVGFDVGEDVG